MPTKLSVNINKIATLRNARGGDVPNLLKMALSIERFGAHGITVHPRPDERHIKKKDVYILAKNISTEFNVEGYPSDDFIALINEIRPAQCTLVPDPPEVLTSNAGWKVWENMDFLKSAIKAIKQSGARVSLFIDPYDYQGKNINQIAQTGCDRIELYTEKYARYYHSDKHCEIIQTYKEIAEKAIYCGLQINAGHDLSLQNLNEFISEIPFISEVSIGHALISDALNYGLKKTIQKYLQTIRKI